MFQSASRMRRWIFDDALPWWGAHGVDHENGGYVERFRLDGRDDEAPFKRTRVTGRQIYVFSHASILGWSPGLQLAAHGIEYLTTTCWLGNDAGFARRVTRTGAILDSTPDLYDLSFVLFAFGWYLRASGDKAALPWAHTTLDLIEKQLSHPSGLGFYHEKNGKGWRQQNPHMHLIEASLVVYEASGDQRFAELAKQIASLFETKFFDAKSETLCELFTDDWQRASGEDGVRIEPGHQFEWAWILSNAKRLVGIDLSNSVRALIRFAERFGVDPASGATYNIVRDDGVPLDRHSRSWPNTERIKAAVALYELDGVDPSAVIDSSAALLFERHLQHQPRGTWIDAFDENGGPRADSIPASTFYHVFLAFAEALRIANIEPHSPKL